MDYISRLERLQDILKKAKIDQLIIEEPVDLLYMTGLQLSAGKLLVDQQSAALFVDGRYREICIKYSPYPVWGVDDTSIIEWYNNPEIKPMASIGFDMDTLTYKKFINWEELLKKVNFNQPERSPKILHPMDSPIKRLREIKDEEEIESLRKAAKLGSEGFDFVCSILKEGITEVEVAAELEIFWKRKGGQSLAFESIIAFGTNSSMPHYRPGAVPLANGNAVLIDIGVKVAHYHSDMTRTVFFGTPSDQMAAIYEIVREAQERALEKCFPGTFVKDLDKAARGYITTAGFGENFSHNLGHGVGLEIHELPWLKASSPDGDKILQKGMVITIEPGLYLQNVGGVRIEDTIVLTENGYENLTDRPKSLLVV